jgi:hypothetical protein
MACITVPFIVCSPFCFVVHVPRNPAEASLRIPTPGERLRAFAGKPVVENAT